MTTPGPPLGRVMVGNTAYRACKHCGTAVIGSMTGDFWLHVIDEFTRPSSPRCVGMPGYLAEPVGRDCGQLCRGASTEEIR